MTAASLAASAEWKEDLQTTADTAARVTAALAGRARNGINAAPGRPAATAPLKRRLGFTGVLRAISVLKWTR